MDSCMDVQPATGGFFTNLFSTDFVPRALCVGDRPEIIWLHVISDGVIALSYYSIPIALLYFVRRRKDLAFYWMFIMFALFILACGSTHVIGVLAFWLPMYRLDGVMKGATGLLSIATAAALWPLLPRALSLPSPSQFREANARLAAEVEERRRAEVLAEAASRAKGEFLAHMSHEIRTPLNGVIGMLELLQGTEMDARQRRYSQLAKTSADLLTTVINDILDFSKIEAGKLEIASGRFLLQETVEDVTEMLAQRASEKGIELACHVEPDVPGAVIGDVDRVRQILLNLMSNAIKFTERGGVIVRLTVESRSAGQCTVRFTVTDTGIGIAPDRMERLFRAFSQADASTTRVYGGTGLGLVISKQLVELMGGTVGVRSEPGRGSIFWFTLPFAADAQEQEAAPRARLDPRALRILAVDDSRIQRDILREQITAWGLDAATAEDGATAINILTDAAAHATPFRVAIVDSEMPGMDGFEFAAAVKARADIRDTVLMILLSVEEAVAPDQLRARGFSGQITKPVRQSQLFNVIMDAVATTQQNDAPTGETSHRAKPAPTAPLPSEIVGARILLAEDNKINQIVASEILIRSGYRCDIVADGKAAVAAVQNEPYDLVLMDCQMPVMDGFEATILIRGHELAGLTAGVRHRRLPIIALTANAMKGDRERCLAAGMDGYASKPIDPPRFLETIAAALAKHPK